MICDLKDERDFLKNSWGGEAIKILFCNMGKMNYIRYRSKGAVHKLICRRSSLLFFSLAGEGERRCEDEAAHLRIVHTWNVANGLTRTGCLDDTTEKSVTYCQYTFIFVTGHYIEQECFRPAKHGFYGFGPVVYLCTCLQDIHTRERSPIPFAKERCGFKRQAVRFVQYHSGVHTAFQVAAQ